jgi:para-nitrobenzyl esterase
MYTTPLAEGLISGVIMQSGGGLRSMGYQQKCQPLAEAEKKGKSFLEALGVSCIAEARKVDVKKIFEVYKEGPQEVGYYHAVIDGYLLKEDPTDTELSDKPPRIPYLLGSNSGECPGTPASPCLPENIKQFEESVHNIFGNKADEFLTLCNVQSMDDVLKIMRGDVFNTRTVGVRAYASVQAEQKRKSYVYFFDHHIPGEDNPGAYHGIELWFVFNSINRCWRPFGGKDYDLARKISGYWINFVKNGDPNGLDMAGETLPEWCSYSNDNPFIMEFSDEPRQMIKEIDPLLEFRIQHHLHRL